MKKRWIILIVLVLLIGIGWYNFFVPHGSARKRLAEYKKELIAKGEKLDMASFAPVRTENANNGANAFLAAVGNWKNPNDFTPVMRIAAPGAAMVGHTNLDAISRSNYEANVAIARKVRAALVCDTLDFIPDYSALSDTTLLPQLSQLKSAAQLFSQTAMQALYNNDLQEAASDLGAVVGMLRLWTHEPMMISSLVRIACVRIGINSTWEALQREGWSDAQLAELQRKWERLDLVESLDRVVAGERVFGINSMAEARKATNALQIDLTAVLSGSNAPSFGEWVGDFMNDPKAALRDAYDRYPKFWLWKSKWSYEEELCGLELATMSVQTCRLIQSNGFCIPALTQLDNQSSNRFWGNRYVNRFLLIPGMYNIYEQNVVKVARAEASRRLLVTTIALKRYQLAHHGLPDTLEQLVPEQLAQVPRDFMDGRPLRYKPVMDGHYLLYSVGEDGVDNGGDPAPLPYVNAIHLDWTAARDIVWPQPATEEQIKDYLAREAKRTNAPPAEK